MSNSYPSLNAETSLLNLSKKLCASILTHKPLTTTIPGYLSSTTCATLLTKDNKPLHVIIKAPPTNPEILKVVRGQRWGYWELQFYEKCAKLLLGIDVCVPKLLHRERDHDDVVLILEDLRERGFMCLDLTEGMEADVAEVVMRCLGQFHGRLRGTVGMFEGLGLSGVDEDFVKRACDGGVKGFLKRYPGVELEWLEGLGRRLMDGGERGNGEGLRSVLHGDLWIPNLLLCPKESDNVGNGGDGECSQVALIDFQCIRIGNVMEDIGLLLFSSMDGNARRKCWDGLLDVYTKSFVQAVRMSQEEKEVDAKDIRDKLIMSSQVRDQVAFQLIAGSGSLLSENEKQRRRLVDAIQELSVS